MIKFNNKQHNPIYKSI